MAAPFSRLQLAAALLEYDNDPSNPSAPYRSAHESAIFAHLRRNPARPPVISQRKSDYLGVALPSETDSVLDSKRKSRVSTIGPLRNPFGTDDHYEEEPEEQEIQEEAEEMDLDLTSWGLDAFMSKDKNAKGKGKAKSLPSTQPLSAVQAHFPKTNDVLGEVQRRPRATRSMSVGNYDLLSPAEEMRRKSFGSPLDLTGMEVPASFQRPVASTSQSLAYDGLAYDGLAPDDEEPRAAAGSIPFPTTSIRSPSPMTLGDDKHRRNYSTASFDSKMAMSARHLRTTSSGTMEPMEDNPFSIAPPSRASKFDPKAAAHARTMSNASLGSRMLLENDGASVMTGRPPLESRFSTTRELLRPKVLVMPSPLQSANVPPPPPKGRDGFILADAPPLPPGARTSTRIPSLGSPSVPVPSNSFTPNPRLNLSLSQLTFRNNLPVGGQRDIAYIDIDGEIPRAAVEGEQVQLSTTPTMEPEIALPIPSETTGPYRPAGKLYGKSLIDDLEIRKAGMKSKQRVFRGDDRPSMMARTPLARSSTLIDPATLQDHPANARASSFEPTTPTTGLARRNSGHAGPLLNFDEDGKVPAITVNKGPPNRSVFGVDTIWEREMVKLREIEAQEAFERERQQAIEETEALKNGKKKKKGKKGKKGQEDQPSGKNLDLSPSVAENSVTESTPADSVVSSGPPVLPAMTPIRGPPPVVDDDTSDDSGESVRERGTQPSKAEGWYADSDDDNDRPRRTTGIGLRYPQKQSSHPQGQTPDDDSEEDLPLAATISRAVERTSRLAPQPPESDSDEEKPLSALMAKSSLPSINFDNLSPLSGAAGGDDDDDQPLGLRASRVLPSSNGDGEDDDRPLALHPEQQRRTQYQMMAQHQMMMNNMQMHNSMFFNPSMSGFFPSPMIMAPPMVQAPIPIPSPPPVHDAAKYGRVDRWRHDVAIEGE
ncbi:hypothetical protein F5878DRAFT_706677 [Lentinula raphanica]|uniref:Uncharacterized protein n=1 Tax=Lentinula raphanica TaxID=153919 RepID=A0AA38PIQ3_9AGAR|nr:hypothetical protein F5878DRAFT_706677 [Lentinula raphanica]